MEAAEIELDRRVIAWEELVEALAVSAAESTAETEAGPERETASWPVPGSTVQPWRDGLPVTVLAPDYQRLLGVLEEGRSGAGAAGGQGDRGWVGLGDDFGEGRGLRSKTRRLAERGWLVQESSGTFSADRRPVPVPVPDAGPSA
ncbi:hypothetical protein [Streptomyces noursei]|uniref:hypothetical protein n=1 Tax=Streptomyces noursei TaxID=1971 RepID=UPI001E3984AB|nr:hypothetical protein [Streptomyces noursei]MCZ1018995.1 hypothetical protein [Streptomyces noursei]